MDPIRKNEPEERKLYDRLAKLDARVYILEARVKVLETENKATKEALGKHQEAIEYIRNCYTTPNVKKVLDKLVGPEEKKRC